MGVSVRSLLFDKGEYIMKLSQKKWKSLISGVLLAASASSFLIAPVYAADYSKPLIGTLKKDSEILSPDGNTVQENDGKLIYDFQGKDHTFTITNKDGITARKDSVYNNVGADGSYGTLHIYQTNGKPNAYYGVNGFIANKGNIIVNSNLDITAASDYSSVGIAAANKGNLIINGNVKMRKDDAENPWGIITKNVHGNVGPGGATSMGGDANYTGARWQPAGISVDYTRGDITVNGDVDIAVRGTAVRTDVYQADGDVPAYDLGTISLLGNSIRIDTPYREENFVEGFGKFIEPYYALASYGGTINVNVKNQEAQNGKVEMVGNVLAMKSSDEAGKAMVYQNGRLNIGLTTQDSSWKDVIDNAGTAKAGEVNLWLQNGALWTNEQQGELPSVWGGEQFKGSFVTNLVGGTNADNAGQIYQKDSNNLTIDTLSGSIRVIYDHEFEDAETRAAGDKKIVYKAGDTVINNAKDGSQVIMATGSNGINTFDKDSVEDAFKGLANKLIYKDAEKNPGNLKAELQLGGGLTGSNVSWSGDIEWDGNNGSYKLDSAEQSIKLLYDEDAVSKDTRAAIMSGMVGWRNAATDTYRARVGAYGEDNQGVWARTWGGQNKYTGNNTSFKNSYWAGQVGYDKTLANGWNVGVAFDYMTGDDSYYAGSGDTKTYTLGLYGSKEISNNEFIDLTAKVGRVSNDFETKDILGRTVKGDYKANGFSFSGQYSKRFGSEAAGYFEPQAQLTIGRLGSCDFDSTGTLEGHISQDAFTSIVGRLGIEAGQASDHGRYFARLSLSHEFAGNVDTHFSDSSASMTREFNLDGTWCDLTVGGTYDLSDKVSFYGDVTKTLTGDYKQDWKVNAGLRFTF